MNKIISEVCFKETYVIGEYRYRLKAFIVRGLQTSQPICVCLPVALIAVFNFKIWYTGVKLGYLQAEFQLQCRIYTGEHAEKFGLDEDIGL